jgi:hypothetical protein
MILALKFEVEVEVEMIQNSKLEPQATIKRRTPSNADDLVTTTNHCFIIAEC